MITKLRHDPLLARFAERLEPKRSDGAPRAGESRLKPLEDAPLRPEALSQDRSRPQALAHLSVDPLVAAHPRPPQACPDRAAFACAHLRRAT